jgi:hypothetical protein
MHFWQFHMVQINIVYTYSPNNTDIYFLHTSKKISLRLNTQTILVWKFQKVPNTCTSLIWKEAHMFKS